MTGPRSPSRRRVLAGGGALVLAFSLRPAMAAVAGEQLPGSLAKAPMLDAWIRIDADNAVTVRTGKAELGQGIRTALLQVAAEQLVVAPGRIHLITADTDRTPDEGYTAGSHSMQDSGMAIRHAAAQVRETLVALAARQLAMPASALRIVDGVVHAPDGRKLSYGALLAGRQLNLRATPEAPLRGGSARFVSGRSLARVDIPAKVSGGAAYLQDLRPEGMVHARIVRPPSALATLVSLDAAAVERLPGVLKVVRDGRFLGVIADREYRAVKAAAALQRAAQWHVPPLPALPPLRERASQDVMILDRGELAAAPLRHAASYTKPFQLHGSIGPSCALALYRDGAYTVWTHSQGVYPLRKALAELLAVKEEALRCIHVEGSGCYGHNGADDVAADAVLLARALPGRPVRVQWMREDEHAWEPHGPPMAIDLGATLAPDGSIAAWRHDVYSPPHNTRPGKAGNLLAGTLLAEPFTPPPAKPSPQPEGAGDRNAIPYYTLPAARVVHHFQATAPVRTSALRSLGAYGNVFAIESFMDELARAARADPVAFRLRHLADPRAVAVVRLAAERFGWNGYKRQAGRGRGFAFARYKNLAAFAAIALEVEASADTGYVRITRCVAAVDCGEVVNPDGVRNQIEGGILQSCSWTLIEQARLGEQGPVTVDWAAYPILRFGQVPDRVEVHLVDRPGAPFLGTGEAAQGPTAGAIANAVADALGLRIRDLPLSRMRVRDAAGTAPDAGRPA
ncbi:CO/xanthine dehydrogenase Mo-binding subunit [Pseudoduganella lurida]|uniref:CO/xanthine dehydrogenase Mo-binding subunit n=1 Tax=Pseudoduganella lurida TaxID=1036180 RepID=A0A562RE24_9BURK|nr:molybdopterin cofactor-binding domain-containing protein [Pseudoduganella lurida]TWI67311.1 CO/xanthine dehydrogenase Mo-binding subunit [Pseudoduganella lurida]